MELAAHILGVIALITTSISMFFKKKAFIMLFSLVYNILTLISYLLLGRYLGCYLIGVAIIRALTFFIFALKNIKPNIYVYIVFNVLAITLSIIFWNDWFDIFLLVALLISTYSTWQTKVKVIKLGAIICMVFYILYNIFAGAYAYIASELVYGCSAIASLIHTAVIEKRNKSKEENNENNNKNPLEN